ncbi:ABC transporter ATP-binding protein [Fusibacter ferrireducens]|uniref:ABC transporter ATP-binding protein n=1 Tax=Fusibacter ferrireducens TaxID=2785058 RepID=A0ABR9ZND8_9FIRM|nr:ABC transporter ATP-binding protein [Fusibacter ferrireducens]MBF4691988.1 ABC transporter ATP-binding protein [Fusibacter ferrireducens]
MSNYILEMNNISKIYGNGVVANSNVSFNLKKGEIHSLVGENGSGKTTLMKILFGMEAPSRGEIILNGKQVQFSDSKEAIKNGIGMVHQHFMLVESFSVAQNIVLGMEMKKRLFVNEEKSIQFTEALSKKYNLIVDPKEITKKLPVGVKQKVEILKALARGAEILILDEPTAVLAPQETEQLFKELMHLKAQGHTIVFISHKIPEIKLISDRITVIRSGKTVGTYNASDVSEKEISNFIMGCEMDISIKKNAHHYSTNKISVDHITYKDQEQVQLLKEINFGVKGGMIFGIAGVQGNGQVELIDMLTRRMPIQNGDISFNGQTIKEDTIAQIRKREVGYIPEDRLDQGVAVKESISDNMISNQIYSEDFCKHGLLNFKKISAFVNRNISDYEIRCMGQTQPIGMLSGGNMQKVVVARECENNPQILIAEQPTRGVDIGAAHIIHKKIIELRDQGCAVLLVSADLNEILKLSDVIAVMYEGEIVAYYDHTEGLNEEQLGIHMLGIERHTPEQIAKAVNRDE